MSNNESITASENAMKFLLQEHSSLRKEIENHLADRKKIDGQVLIGIFAIYVWSLTRAEGVSSELLIVSLFLPPVVVALGFLKWLSIMFKMFSAAEYLKKIELQFLNQENLGWEHFLEKRRIDKPIIGRVEGWVESLFWALAFSFSVAASTLATSIVLSPS